MAGAIIKIEKDLIDGGCVKILKDLSPLLYDKAGPCNPRVVTGCAILLYFTYKVCVNNLINFACMCNEKRHEAYLETVYCEE